MQSQVSLLQGWPNFRGDFVPFSFLLACFCMQNYFCDAEVILDSDTDLPSDDDDDFFLKLKDLTCVMN